jgi:DNA-binding transcriptional regulator YhcF (GntR family)
MSKTVLTDVDGFTPLIDVVTTAVGLTAAAVFGRIWRFCQMELEVCTASHQTIADDLGLARETVSRSCKALVEAGFLEEVNSVGITKTYRDTGKAGFKMTLSAGLNNRTTCDLKSQVVKKKAQPVINNHSTCDLKSQGVSELITAPVTFNHTKIDSNIGVKREEERSSQIFSENFPTASALLEAIKTTVKPQFDQTNWQRKVQPLWVYEVSGKMIILGTQNAPACDWLNSRAVKLFAQAARGLDGQGWVFSFRVADPEPA